MKHATIVYIRQADELPATGAQMARDTRDQANGPDEETKAAIKRAEEERQRLREQGFVPSLGRR